MGQLLQSTLLQHACKCTTLLHGQNNPLYIKVLGGVDAEREQKLHFVVHCSLDVIEEKGEAETQGCGSCTTQAQAQRVRAHRGAVNPPALTSQVACCFGPFPTYSLGQAPSTAFCAINPNNCLVCCVAVHTRPAALLPAALLRHVPGELPTS